MENVTVISHPLVQHSLTRLRDAGTPSGEFRRLVGEVATLMLYEATRELAVAPQSVRTPVARARGTRLASQVLLVPIMRAGLGMLEPMLQLIPGARVGFVGWSYGGFLAARAMLDADTPLAAAIAGAPPTDWTLYDTAYTERYLGLPDGGRAEAYAQSNLVNRAALLSKPLMLIHGTADDNVLFDHTLRLIQALQNEGKLFETAIYPGHAHSVAGRKARLHLARTQFDFFQRHLAPAQRPR